MKNQVLLIPCLSSSVKKKTKISEVKCFAYYFITASVQYFDAF